MVSGCILSLNTATCSSSGSANQYGENKAALDALCMLSCALRGSLSTDDIVALWSKFQATILMNEVMAARYMASVAHTKVLYEVQDPKIALLRENKTIQRYNPQANIITLGEEHIGDALYAYNFDLIDPAEYDHMQCHGQKTWSVLIDSVRPILSPSFCAYAKELATVPGVYASRQAFMLSLRSSM